MCTILKAWIKRDGKKERKGEGVKEKERECEEDSKEQPIQRIQRETTSQKLIQVY